MTRSAIFAEIIERQFPNMPKLEMFAAPNGPIGMCGATKFEQPIMNEPHPLQSIVLAAFSEQERHDPVTLGTFMAGYRVPKDRDGRWRAWIER
jgi:hypothetical protein